MVRHSSYRRWKRLADVVVSAAGLTVTAPAQVAIAILVRYKLGSPALFRQRRPGLHGVPFTLVKFRSMSVDDPTGGASDADRLTTFGSWLRSTSLDELPTLWNVLKGDMSVVGPRPLLMGYLGRYSHEQSRRHEVRPGITGLAQVCGRNALTWPDRLAADVAYVDNCSFTLDVRILAKTVSSVLRRDGINGPGEATMAEFRGNSALPEESCARAS